MEAEKYEHRKALKSDLLTFWIWLQGQLTEDAKARDALLITELNGLLRDRGEDFSWIEANRAELLMLPLLPEPALDSQMRRRLDQAQREGALSPERYAEMIKRFFDKGAPASLEVKREGYRALLTELHQYFLNRRFRRDQRTETARVLKWFTIWILVLAILPIAAFSLVEPLTDEWLTPKYLMTESFVLHCRGRLVRDPWRFFQSPRLLSRAACKLSASSSSSTPFLHSSLLCVALWECSELSFSIS